MVNNIQPFFFISFTYDFNLWKGVKVIAHGVQNFRTLKNKYDLTSCQSRLHTASKYFAHHKKFGSGSIFCVFASVATILIGKDDETKKAYNNWPLLFCCVICWASDAFTFTFEFAILHLQVLPDNCLFCLHLYTFHFLRLKQILKRWLHCYSELNSTAIKH